MEAVGLTPDERAFAAELGNRLVDAAAGTYRESVRDGRDLDGRCVAAAAAFALAIVYDPAGRG